MPPTHTGFVPNAIRLSELKVGAISNTSSAGSDSESEQKMLSIPRRAGVVEPRMWCGGADHMEPSFADAAEQKLEVLILLGGDGTIRTAAEACAEKGPLSYPSSWRNDEYAPSSVVWRCVMGRRVRKNAYCSPGKAAFRRSDCGQTCLKPRCSISFQGK